MASPGPGKGCRSATDKPSSRPTFRTSSLYRSRSGSTRQSFMISGRPPTLWCDLITARSSSPDSIQSGAMVPWTRQVMSSFSAVSSNIWMNLLPMIFRFFSGSVMPWRDVVNSFVALTNR